MHVATARGVLIWTWADAAEFDESLFDADGMEELDIPDE
jgi:hypothetical protein